MLVKELIKKLQELDNGTNTQNVRYVTSDHYSNQIEIVQCDNSNDIILREIMPIEKWYINGRRL
jgi:hypothetical protein